MRFASRIACTVLTLFSFIFAQDFVELSGSLPEHLTSEKPYSVVADIYVSPGSTVTIDAGAVFLFESFTGMHVQGTVYVKGEAEKPVVFTSKNDRQWNLNSGVDAAPFDWNGIDIYETAIGTDFTQCVIQYSVYGLRSQTEHFKVNNLIFSNNGKANVSIKGEKREVLPNEPFSYGQNTAATVIPEPDLLPETVTDTLKKPVDLIKEKPRKRSSAGIQILRYTGLAAALGSAAAAAWYYENSFKISDQKLKDLSVLDNKEMLIYTSKDWESAERERNKKLALCISGAGGALIGLGLFVLTFTF
ncbi:MAG: hypothetical protein GX556_17305 [Fibrobacter sp.]|nr:hypothetical protein [Fibrobacter sp.]